MKAMMFDDYGPVSVLRYADAADPVPGEGEVLVRVAAASVDPIDVKIRSGAVRDRTPVDPAAFAAALQQQGAGVTPPGASPALMRDDTGRSPVAAG